MEQDLNTDPLLRTVPEIEGYKVLSPCVLYARIGQGGMGTVYRGRHLNLDVEVAVKCLKSGLAAENPDLVVRFQREARIAASVHHQNLVQVYDVSHQSGVHYLVMEFVRGETARDRVRRKGPLAEAEAGRILLGAARGLAEAHAQRIVHRDVKPDNILISHDGKVKVSDLGLAKALEGEELTTLTHGVMGTPQYMAPEQWADSSKVGPAADVWALGATLYFLLTGEDAVRATNMHECYKRICVDAFPDVRLKHKGLSETLVSILERCVDRDPAVRYRDCRELANDLKQVLLTDTTRLDDPREAGRTVVEPLVSPPPPPTMARIRMAFESQLATLQLTDQGGERAFEQPVGPLVSPTTPAPRTATPWPDRASTPEPRLRTPARGAIPPDRSGPVRAPSAQEMSPLADSSAPLAPARDARSASDAPRSRRPAWIAVGVTVAVLLPALFFATRGETPGIASPVDAAGPSADPLPTNPPRSPVMPASGGGPVQAPRSADEPSSVPPPEPKPPPPRPTVERVVPDSRQPIYVKGENFEIAGTTRNASESKLTARVDESPYTVDVQRDGSFRWSAPLGADGEHVVTLFDETTEPTRLTIIRDSARPELELADGTQEGRLVRQQAIDVRMIAKDANLAGVFRRVESQDRVLVEQPDRQWLLHLPSLEWEGPNSFQIVAIDKAGNERVREITVVLDSALPKLLDLEPDEKSPLRPFQDNPIRLTFDEPLARATVDGRELEPEPGSDGKRWRGVVKPAKAADSCDVSWSAEDRVSNRASDRFRWSVLSAQPRAPEGFEIVDATFVVDDWVRGVHHQNTGIKLLLLPGGEFAMGSSDAKSDADERPQVRVAITRPFYLGATEVSRGQWRRVMEPGAKEKSDDALPIVDVTWFEAKKFCEKTRCFRLPFEAEWEFACRAGKATAYWTGDTITSGMACLNDTLNPRVGPQLPMRVDSVLETNPWGFLHMHGNVREWCMDAYDPTWYATLVQGSPPIKDPRNDSQGAQLRVLRGGAYYFYSANCRSASRGGGDPGKRFPEIGFRVAMDLPAGK